MKNDITETEETAPEYDFSAGERGKFATQYAQGSNVIVLAPEVAAVFPDAESVNNALRGLIALARQTVKTG